MKMYLHTISAREEFTIRSSSLLQRRGTDLKSFACGDVVPGHSLLRIDVPIGENKDRLSYHCRKPRGHGKTRKH